MKKIFRTVPCILISAFTLIGACACENGVSDIRNRERQLRERMREEQQQQRLAEQEERTLEEIDPDFMVDPECPECPDCPDIPEQPEEGTRTEDNGDTQKTIPPEFWRKPPRKGLGKKPKPTPAPYPLPHD